MLPRSRHSPAFGGANVGLGSLWMILATVVLNLSMVAYHRVMSAGLKDGYAELAALTALTNVLGVITLGASTTLVKIFAEDEAENGPGAARWRFRSLATPIAKAMLGASLLLLCLAPLAVSYLKLGSAVPYALVSALFVLSLGVLSSRAAVQGTQRFNYFGLSIALEGVGRLGFGALFVSLGWGVSGALGGAVLALLVGLAICLAGIRTLGEPTRPPKREILKGIREMAADATVLGLFSLICYLDVFIVKHQMADEPASNYARAALVAKSFLYLGSALNMVLLPAVSSARAKGGALQAKKALFLFLGGALALDLAGLAFVWTFTPLVIRILCGGDPSFQSLAPLIRIFSAVVVPLALSQMVLYYLLAARDYRSLVLLLGVSAVFAFFLQQSGGEASRVVVCVGGAAAALLLGSLGLVLMPVSVHARRAA